MLNAQEVARLVPGAVSVLRCPLQHSQVTHYCTHPEKHTGPPPTLAMRARYAAEGASCGIPVSTLPSRLLALAADIRLTLLWVLL
jgi:hypothetical protein